MTDRKAQKRRLERAGFVHVAGWLPTELAENVAQWAELYQGDVARVLAEPPLPRGRPKGKEA